MNQRSRKSEDDHANAALMKSKVRELEAEVSKLKQRLEDLRKAKNSTILKREREVIQVGGPNLGRPAGVETSKYKELERKLIVSEKKNTDLEKDLQTLNEQHRLSEQGREDWKEKCAKLQQDIEEMQIVHEVKMAEIGAESREHKAKADDLCSELERIREKLEVKSMQEENKQLENHEREIYITDLINENTTLRVKVESLFNQLSEKEALWLQSKEMIVKKIQEKWDTKYARWMSDTEKRIEELRAANLVLKQCLMKRDENDEPSTSGMAS